MYSTTTDDETTSAKGFKLVSLALSVCVFHTTSVCFDCSRFSISEFAFLFLQEVKVIMGKRMRFLSNTTAAVSLLLLLLFVMSQPATTTVSAALHTCSGSGISLVGESLGDATFDDSCNAPVGQTISIAACTATSITFSAALSGLALIRIKDVDCSAGTGNDCVVFAASVTGGAIEINGLKRTFSGGGTAKNVHAVRFAGNVNNMESITLSSIEIVVSKANLKIGETTDGHLWALGGSSAGKQSRTNESGRTEKNFFHTSILV